MTLARMQPFDYILGLGDWIRSHDVEFSIVVHYHLPFDARLL